MSERGPTLVDLLRWDEIQKAVRWPEVVKLVWDADTHDNYDFESRAARLLSAADPVRPH
jgi:hypothetical protein